MIRFGYYMIFPDAWGQSPPDPPDEPEDEGIAAGDQLQSAASRLAEWVLTQDPPYEVHMAALEAQGAVEDWTAARCSSVVVAPDLRDEE